MSANKVTWAIQVCYLNDNQILTLWDEVKRQGASPIEAIIRPFIDEITFADALPDNKFVVPYGSTKMTSLALKEKWKGIFFDSETFNVEAWIEHRNDMLNQEVLFTTVGEAESVLTCSDDEVLFVRPKEDLKAFTGTVTNAKEIRRWMTSVDSGNFQFNEDTEIAISKPQNILMEWRYFVVGGKIVSGSIYRRNGVLYSEKETDASVLKEAQEAIDKWLPHETCVVDLALCDVGLKVIEFNCFNSTGFYDHDVSAIVKSINEYVEDL